MTSKDMKTVAGEHRWAILLIGIGITGFGASMYADSIRNNAELMGIITGLIGTFGGMVKMWLESAFKKQGQQQTKQMEATVLDAVPNAVHDAVPSAVNESIGNDLHELTMEIVRSGTRFERMEQDVAKRDERNVAAHRELVATLAHRDQANAKAHQEHRDAIAELRDNHKTLAAGLGEVKDELHRIADRLPSEAA